jgi:hypothetical protein
MTRRESIFDIIPNAKTMIREKVEKEGSQLGRVLARCAWNAEYRIHILLPINILLLIFRSVSSNDQHFRPVTSIDLTFDLDAAKIFVKILR